MTRSLHLSDTLLRVENLRTFFFTDAGVVKAVDGVSFRIRKGETLGLVGESGCGKSVTALSLLRLIPSPPGRIIGGRIDFRGTSLIDLPVSKMRSVRGAGISIIFQEPMTSLNPVYTIGNQIMEAVLLHRKLSRREAKLKTVELLELVGIPSPAERLRNYPHQLSGGMRQRVMIAMALAGNPQLLIADEPTTALDVTIQAQILSLLQSLQTRFQMSVLLITHDLGIIAEMADHVAVMYAGKIVEYAPVHELFNFPSHPYTRGLISCLPDLEHPKHRLTVIEGMVPDLIDLPSGCTFVSRCPCAQHECSETDPSMEEVRAGHWVACTQTTPIQ